MLLSFYGFENEDLYKYLDEFLNMYGTMRIHNVDDDALRLKLFPFSLRERDIPSILRENGVPQEIYISSDTEVASQFFDEFSNIHKQAIDASYAELLILKSEDDAW